MNTKLALLAVVTLVAIVTSAAIAGRDKTKTPTREADKPVALSCCAMGGKAPAPGTEREAPAKSGMSCHSDAGESHASAAKPKSCCK